MNAEQQLNTLKAKKRATSRLILLLLLGTVFLALSWQSNATAFFVFFAFVPVFVLLNDRGLVTRDKPLLLILSFLSMFFTAYAGVYWIRNVNPSTHLVIAFLRGLTMFLPFLMAYLYIFSRGKTGPSASDSNGKPRGTVNPGKTGSSEVAGIPGTISKKDNSKQNRWRNGLSGHTPIAVFILAWMITEVLNDLNIFGLSYGNLGHILAAYPAAIQWYVFTGNLGGTLWILLANLAIFLLLCRLFPQLIRSELNQAVRGRKETGSAEFSKADFSNIDGFSNNADRSNVGNLSYSSDPGNKETRFRSLSWIIVVILLAITPLLISVLMYRAPLQSTPTNINVIALHTSMDVYDYKYEVDPDVLLDAYISSTKKYLVPGKPNIVFWPENALTGGLFMDSLEHSPTVKRIRDELISETNTMVVAGAIIDQVTNPPPSGTYAPQILFNEAQGYHFKRYNTALFVTRDGQSQVKKKKRLVPMSEQVPKQKIFAPLVRLVPNLEEMNFSPAGDGYTCFEFRDSIGEPGSKTLRTSPIICYGSAFSTFTAGEVKHTQSDFLAILLNEGWMQSETAYRHFKWFAICRAIENRRFVVKSSNEGITTLIDSKGNTGEQLSGKNSGAVTGNLQVNEKMTFYTNYHKGIVYGLLILSILLLLWLWIGPPQKKPRKG